MPAQKAAQQAKVPPFEDWLRQPQGSVNPALVRPSAAPFFGPFYTTSVGASTANYTNAASVSSAG